MKQQHSFFLWGSILAMLAVVLGAFTTHTLSEMISPVQLASFRTGVRYQFYHAFALLLLGVIQQQNPTISYKGVGRFFIIGTLLFSLSIYLLATKDLTHISTKILGPLTPIGGLSLILGWGQMIWLSYKEWKGE